MKTTKHRLILTRGFTLIELLVVIAIIGILSSVVLASLNTARAKSRDAARLSTIHQIANALFLSLDANGGNFPSSGGAAVCLGTAGTCWGGVISGNASINTFLQPYLSQIPMDPSHSSGVGDRYVYADSSVGVAYHCTATSMQGPFIFWEPEVLIPSSDAPCGNLGFYACCSSALGCFLPGNINYYCAYKIQ